MRSWWTKSVWCLPASGWKHCVFRMSICPRLSIGTSTNTHITRIPPGYIFNFGTNLQLDKFRILRRSKVKASWTGHLKSELLLTLTSCHLDVMKFHGLNPESQIYFHMWPAAYEFWWISKTTGFLFMSVSSSRTRPLPDHNLSYSLWVEVGPESLKSPVSKFVWVLLVPQHSGYRADQRQWTDPVWRTGGTWTQWGHAVISQYVNVAVINRSRRRDAIT